MNYKDILNILCCPECKNSIEDDSGKLNCSSCDVYYSVQEGVPQLVSVGNTDNEYGMDYIDHYRQDAEIFDYFEERECKATEHEERRVREYLRSLIPKGKNRILDVGSGGAWAAKELAPDSDFFISFDLADKNVRKALEKFPHENHYGVVGDSLKLPFVKNVFDVIIASEIIEHIVDPRLFVDGLLQILKPGGMLIISTPYKEKITYSQCIHCNKMTPKNAHLHSFDEEILNELSDKNLTKSSRYFIFGNKGLNVLRTHVFLSFLPLTLWKLIDRMANVIVNKPAHIIMQYRRIDE